jgi:hypothetical protein
MIDLQKEAEQYADNTIGVSNEKHSDWIYVQHHIIEFVKQSKYVESEKLKAQTEVLEKINQYHDKFSAIESKLTELKQQFKQLKDES